MFFLVHLAERGKDDIVIYNTRAQYTLNECPLLGICTCSISSQSMLRI